MAGSRSATTSSCYALTPFDAYLLTVRPPLQRPELRPDAIGLTSTGNTGSLARLDSVTVKNMRCPIAGIRKVDCQRMQADMRAEAAKAKGRRADPQ